MNAHSKNLRSWVVAPLALVAGTVGIAIYSHHGVAAAADDTAAGPPPPPPATEAAPPPPRDSNSGPGGDLQGPPRRGEGMSDRQGPPDPAKLFDLMDTNHDGSISRDEFVAFHAKHRPPFGPEGLRGGRPDGMRGQGDRQGPPSFEKDGQDGQGRQQFGPPRGEGFRGGRPEGMRGQGDHQGPPSFDKEGLGGQGRDQFGPTRGEGNRGPRPQADGMRGKMDGQAGECPGPRGEGNRPQAEGSRGKMDSQGGEFGPPRGALDDRRDGPPDPASLIKKIDTNGDGTLSQSEIAAFLANHRPPRGPANEQGAQGPHPGAHDGPAGDRNDQDSRPGPPEGPDGNSPK